MQLYDLKYQIMVIINPEKCQFNLRYPLPLYLINENWLIP